MRKIVLIVLVVLVIALGTVGFIFSNQLLDPRHERDFSLEVTNVSAPCLVLMIPNNVAFLGSAGMVDRMRRL